MTKVKQQAYEKIRNYLEEELKRIQTELRRNKWDIKKLAERQAVIKREYGAILELIRQSEVLQKGKTK